MDKDFFSMVQSETNPEKLLVQLLFHFSVLIEYQLNDLQSEVRSFVEAMSTAIQEMDNLVVAEGKSAQDLFENLFNQNQSQDSEASKINTRANKRADEIFSETLSNLHGGKTPASVFNSDPNVQKTEEVSQPDRENIQQKPTQENSNEEISTTVSSDKIWSDIAKRFESFCRMEERLRPQVYTMIQSLNFEDIQTQRIEHALTAQKKLNEGIISLLKKGLQNCDIQEIRQFATNLVTQTKASYTMMDERAVFDQVFLKPEE
jgi:hypothetical protein